MPRWLWILVVIVAPVIGVAIHDVVQRRHAILRNFPVVGHFRYLIEKIGPELRQYVVADNDEELPFSRDQRRYIYASAKQQNAYFGFGTDNDIDRPRLRPPTPRRVSAPLSTRRRSSPDAERFR